MIDLVAFRRDLHRHPEVGPETARTATAVAEALTGAGVAVTRGVGGHGLVATIGTGDSAIMLRADMDALPIREMAGLPHASTVPGAFHGCGHDGHSTMLLGAALALAADPSGRTIHLIWQPDEENGTGARAMIEDGLFDRFPTDRIYGLHNMPGLPLGHVQTQPGLFLVFEDNFRITIDGRGGHASQPHAQVDPVIVAGAIIGQLQTIVARNVDAADHAVVSITGIETDGARNVVPSTVVLTGDCRGFSDATRDLIRTRMARIAEGCAAAHGAKARVEAAQSFRPLVNDPEATARAVAALRDVEVDAAAGRFGYAEDFAAYLDHRPGAFLNVGNGTEGCHALPLHNPGYDFNDDGLVHGVEIWTRLAHHA
ncbi:MAG: amidohydrolase [Pseudomonadota bacterium]